MIVVVTGEEGQPFGYDDEWDDNGVFHYYGLTLISVFVLPVLDLIGRETASKIFGLAVLLLVGYAFALAGHYEMYNPNTARSMDYFPFKEQVAAAGVGIGAVTYLVIAVVK